MSARRRPLILAPQARQDLSDLLLYSEQRWGKRRRRAYKATLDRAMDELTRFPGLGRSRDDIAPGLRGHPIGEHVIFCRVGEQAVTITRILHQKMDAADHLDEPQALRFRLAVASSRGRRDGPPRDQDRPRCLPASVRLPALPLSSRRQQGKR